MDGPIAFIRPFTDESMLATLIDYLRHRPTLHRKKEVPVERTPECPTLGLALSSGGARGLAHVGVLQVLEENHIPVHAIAGSSMGAYVAALWAAGFSGKALGELAAEMHDPRALWHLADPLIPPMKGLFRGLKVKAHLERSLGDTRFEDLQRELFIIALDIDTKERVVFRSGRLVDVVHASCAIPGIVAPVLCQGHRCVDGGIIDPVPVGALRKFGTVDRVVAVSVVPTFSDVDAGLCKPQSSPQHPWWQRSLLCINRNVNLLASGNMIDTLHQSIRAAQIRIAQASCWRADLCIRPAHCSVAWHDYKNFRQLIDAGRQAATESLPAIRKLLSENATTDIPA